MPKKKIGAYIALDGEKEFRSSVTSCNKSLSTMKSEMKLVEVQTECSANSLETLQKKHNVLSKILEEQIKKENAVKLNDPPKMVHRSTKSLTKEEIRCIQKYTLNETKEKPKFYERLNAMLRGDAPEEQKLRYYADMISGVLKKSVLEENVICYRGADINPVEGISVGKYIRMKQFISTSVDENRSFDKPVKIIIYAKNGTRGVAYIENISKLPKQKEMLFDKDCIYRVLSNQDDFVELEVI